MTILLIVLLLLNIFLAFCGYYLASELEKKKNDSIKILENIESEIKIKRDKLDNNLNLLKECKMQGYSDSIGILEKYISKLKGATDDTT